MYYAWGTGDCSANGISSDDISAAYGSGYVVANPTGQRRLLSRRAAARM